MKTFLVFAFSVLSIFAADPAQPKVGVTPVINATNGYGGTLTIRTQLNVGYPLQTGVLTLSDNGTVFTTINGLGNASFGGGIYVFNSLTNAALQPLELVFADANRVLGSVAPGNAGDVLTSAGAGVAPSFGPPLINPTVGVVPVKIDATHFGDSTISTNGTNIVIAGNAYINKQARIGVNFDTSNIGYLGTTVPGIAIVSDQLIDGIGNAQFQMYSSRTNDPNVNAGIIGTASAKSGSSTNATFRVRSSNTTNIFDWFIGSDVNITNGTGTFFQFSGAAGPTMVFTPAAPSGSTIYKMASQNEMTSGYLLVLANTPTTNVMRFGPSGVIEASKIVSLNGNFIVGWNGSTNTVIDTAGNGSPEGVVTASPGSIYRDYAGGTNTVWVKQTGNGNIGWAAMNGSSGGGGGASVNPTPGFLPFNDAGIFNDAPVYRFATNTYGSFSDKVTNSVEISNSGAVGTYLHTVTDGNGLSGLRVYENIDAGTVFNLYDRTGNAQLHTVLGNNSSYMDMTSDGTPGWTLNPSLIDGAGVPYAFYVNNSHTSNDIFQVYNNGKKLGLTWNGSLSLSGQTNLLSISGGQLLLDGSPITGGSGGTIGTVINTGTPAVGNVPAYSDTTGTNVAPFANLTLTSTNASLKGTLTANNATFTSSLKLLNATASQPARIGADQTVTNGVINLGSSDVTGSLPNANLANSSITVQGAAVALGGSTLATNSSPTFGDLKLLGGPWIDVRTYGAVGDGTTDDTTAVRSAVNAAYAAGVPVLFIGTNLTTGTITNLHNIVKLGVGAVKRGSDLFYVAIRSGLENHIYIDTTNGVAANDGLSASQPLATFQQAFDVLEKYGPVLGGTWYVEAAAGTYTISTGSHNLTTPSRNRVVVRGPTAGHPNVPTCLVDGGGNTASYLHGLNFDGIGVRVDVRDIKFQNFTEASGNTRCGLVGANGADIYTQNVHSFACSWTGMNIKECSEARISGGILDATNGAYGIVIDSTHGSVGYGATSTTNGPQIKNAGSANVYWSTGSQGHIDYCTILNGPIGVLLAENSRADMVADDLQQNTVGIRTRTGSYFGQGGTPIVFNDGTTNANTTDIQYYALSGNSDELKTSQGWTRVAYDRASHATGTGAATTALNTNIYVIPAYRLQGVGKQCRVVVVGDGTISASSSFTVTFGGMSWAVTVPAAGTSINFIIDVTLYEVAGGYRAVGTILQGANGLRNAAATSGFTNSSDQAIGLSVTTTGGSDIVTVRRIDVYLEG